MPARPTTTIIIAALGCAATACGSVATSSPPAATGPLPRGASLPRAARFAGAVSTPEQAGWGVAQRGEADRGSADPYSPAYLHAYRAGVVPMLARQRRMRAWAAHGAGLASTAIVGGLRYGGGRHGIGVTAGHEKVYLVFWGSQWGARRTSQNGELTLSGDHSGEAPYLQRMFRGLGTGGENWSGVMTQYCQAVPAGATTCPAGSQGRVAYPTGGALAGVWADESGAAPSRASGHRIAAEAVLAAAHFGNRTATSNRDAQYVIMSPTGTHPDGFNTDSGDFCSWHDWNGDQTLTGGPVSSPYGDVAFTNLPYLTDAGLACGEDFVNSGRPGLLDGVSIVAGHEYAETITDQDPPYGWIGNSGQENGDLCAWDSGPGAPAADVTLSTGAFAMQPTWSNDAGACELWHPVVSNGGGGGRNVVVVTNPGNRHSSVGTPISLRIRATDSAAGQVLTYASDSLPVGLRIGGTTGLISGWLARAGSYQVKVIATDLTGARASTMFTWTVVTPGGFFERTARASQPQAWLSLNGCANSPLPLPSCSIRAPSWRSSSSAAPATARAAGSPAWREPPGRS